MHFLIMEGKETEWGKREGGRAEREREGEGERELGGGGREEVTIVSFFITQSLYSAISGVFIIIYVYGMYVSVSLMYTVVLSFVS